MADRSAARGPIAPPTPVQEIGIRLNVIETMNQLVKDRYRSTGDGALKIAADQIAANIAGIRELLRLVEQNDG